MTRRLPAIPDGPVSSLRLRLIEARRNAEAAQEVASRLEAVAHEARVEANRHTTHFDTLFLEYGGEAPLFDVHDT